VQSLSIKIVIFQIFLCFHYKLRGLVKHYLQQGVSEIKGPVSLVTGKRKRVTFIEVPNDITEMTDAAKVADYVSSLSSPSLCTA
jgi:hypothetical protein